MKLNGSSNFYIMNKDIASKTRLDAFESLVNTSLPDREMYRYKADNGVVTDIMSTYHNYEDSKLILKYLCIDLQNHEVNSTINFKKCINVYS